MIIDAFTGDNDFLSNFYPCVVHYNGLIYRSSEAAYQAAKTLDEEEKFRFTVMSARDSKKEGKLLKCRPDWDQVKDDIMYDIVKIRFQNPVLARKLLSTNTAILVEGNNWGDFYWGVCKGQGENKLGKILMRVREELRNA